MSPAQGLQLTPPPPPPPRRWAAPDNPSGTWRNAVSDDSIILHYAYSYEQEVAAKAERSCPGPEYAAAARAGNRTKVRELGGG